MSMLKRVTASKTGLAVLGGVCLIVVAAPGAFSTGTARGSASSTPPPVDHQLCYAAAGVFQIPAGVPIRIIDQFNPNGYIAQVSGKSGLLCNPVKKMLPTGKIFGVTNPRAHLVCFPETTAKSQPTPPVVVTNQFGKAVLQPVQKPNSLCVPSWKSLTGPPNIKPTTPPGLNHFSCYAVKVLSGGYKVPGGIKLQDEFTKTGVQVDINPIPVELCLPAEKIIGKQVFPMINPVKHLLCFPVSKTPTVNPVWAENQFGTSKMNVIVTKRLCVPSTKKIG